MSDTGSEKQLVLSAAEVRKWRAQAAEIDREVELLGKRKIGILKKIAAAELLAPSLFIADLIAAPLDGLPIIRSRKGRVTWTSLIEEQVRNSGEGIRQRDVLEEMRAGPYGDRMRNSESGYYNAIQKLLKREILKKKGDFLFTPAQYDEYMEKLERGEVRDVAEEASFGSAAAAQIVRFVEDTPGQASIDLIRAVWDAHEDNHPPSKTSLYNTIARLVEQKHIRKEDGKYYPSKKKEAPASEPEDASEIRRDADDANGAASLPFESQGEGFHRPLNG